MVIMHYFLGFPPYRSGGLTKYCMDLMEEQRNHGDEVIALWPGQILSISKKLRIIRRKSIKKIKNYELINPLPISLDEGIKDVEAYTKPCDQEVYRKFLEEIKPDIIHIHTLMGLHNEFLKIVKELKIKVIFTSHDFFGICPKVTLYKNGEVCIEDHQCRDCVECNRTALSLKKIKIMQSIFYRSLKESFLVKKIRKKHREEFFIEDIPKKKLLNKKEKGRKIKEYKRLRNYYIKMLQNMDLIHFNSSMTKEVYKKYFELPKSKVVTISHKNVMNQQNDKKNEKNEKLRITCLAPARPSKGYNILIGALDELWYKGNKSFNLTMFNIVPDRRPYLKVIKAGFTQSDLPGIMSNTDVLIAPSVGYDTFGFTVLEALSYGIPVIVSDHVGAKDIVGKSGVVVKAGSLNELKIEIETLIAYPEKLMKLRQEAMKNKIKIWEQFVEENYQMYDELIKY